MLSNKLKELRDNLKMPQEHVCKAIFKSRGAYAAYETGKATPSPSTLILLCKFFEVTPNEILEWD
jgi:transcriptional regulator with XRE-family HTH domain